MVPNAAGSTLHGSSYPLVCEWMGEWVNGWMGGTITAKHFTVMVLEKCFIGAVHLPKTLQVTHKCFQLLIHQSGVTCLGCLSGLQPLCELDSMVWVLFKQTWHKSGAIALWILYLCYVKIIRGFKWLLFTLSGCSLHRLFLLVGL